MTDKEKIIHFTGFLNDVLWFDEMSCVTENDINKYLNSKYYKEFKKND